ncbi:MAG: hypothetical protein Q8Q23_00935 [bacterium]|nr:hypothetical protein [bacterium]
MDFSNFKISHFLKIAGVALVTIIVVAIAFRLLGSSFTSIIKQTKLGNVSSGGMFAYDLDKGYAENMADGADSGAALSARNVIAEPAFMPPREDEIISGDDAEEFEVTEYNAYIETRHLDTTCAAITDLKTRADVIFENANEYDQGCGYNFKVKRESVAEVLTLIKNLDPKDLSENTFTIKKQIEDFTSETEILQKKLDSINETLENAISAYDDITELATQTRDAESLAKIIDSKIGIIERLTQSRINTGAQLERLERAKAEALDRLAYTYFHVNISENKFIDGEQLKDSWKMAVKQFVRDVNDIAQDLSINLATLLLLILQYVIYLGIILVIAKYGWRLAKYFWQK